MIFLILVAVGLVSCVATMEISQAIEKEWLKSWSFRINHFPECPPWTRHYRLVVVLGPRVYRWTA